MSSKLRTSSKKRKVFKENTSIHNTISSIKDERKQSKKKANFMQSLRHTNKLYQSHRVHAMYLEKLKEADR